MPLANSDRFTVGHYLPAFLPHLSHHSRHVLLFWICYIWLDLSEWTILYIETEFLETILQ